VPPNGSMPRYLEQVALSFIATEVHALMGPLFSPDVSPEVRSFTVERLQKKFEFMDKSFIAGKSFLVGDSFTVADAYLYVVLSWTPYLKLDLSPYSNVQRYFNGIGAMEEVKAAQERMATNPSTTI
jgi:glutathione S-transferase